VAKQYVERDGQQNRFIEGFWGIFGHGNVSGLGQGIVDLAEKEGLRFYRPQHEQGMVSQHGGENAQDPRELREGH
jgi:3D-(3,5/4)-trihydroxycyclohexane-1,2-dione acylhydrolase (decyclizing)